MDNELSLYFHIPFCTKKCPYCHFYVVKDQTLLKKRLISALKKEWEQKWPLIKGKDIASIYFGGGTPSLLSYDEFAEIFSLFDFPLKTCEITLEGNPESITDLKSLKTLGFNRLSIGVQSFDDEQLKILGRNHDSARSITTIYEAFNSGFENISIDLMYDLPNQTVKSFEKTLKTTLTLPITHVSLYNLTIEPFTTFYKLRDTLKNKLPNEKESLAMHELALHYLASLFKRYEISAFAKQGCQSRHNTGYWTFRPFLGFGPSAFSYFEKARFSNISNIIEYEKRLQKNEDPIDFKEHLKEEEQFREWLAIRLRLFTPFSIEKAPSPLKQTIQDYQEQGFIEAIGEKICLTQKGALFYDTIATSII